MRLKLSKWKRLIRKREETFTNASGLFHYSLLDKERADLCESISVLGELVQEVFMPRGAPWMEHKLIPALKTLLSNSWKKKTPPIDSICTLVTICHRHDTTTRNLICDDGGCMDSSHRFKRMENVFTFHLIEHCTSWNKSRGFMTAICGCGEGWGVTKHK